MKAGGALISYGDDGKKEADTITCAHCNRVQLLARDRGGVGFCLLCYRPVCERCTAKCDPFEKKLERMEQRARLMEAIQDG